MSDAVLNTPCNRQLHGEHWTKDGLSWTRHHLQERCGYFMPVCEPGGPDTHLLEDTRLALLHYPDGTTSERLDNWRGHYESLPTSDKPWTGATASTENMVCSYQTTQPRKDALHVEWQYPQSLLHKSVRFAS